MTLSPYFLFTSFFNNSTNCSLGFTFSIRDNNSKPESVRESPVKLILDIVLSVTTLHPTTESFALSDCIDISHSPEFIQPQS